MSASGDAATSTSIPSPQTLEISSQETIYTRGFWWAYIANLMLVTANALTFRFAELINLLGGTQQAAGLIVSVGSIGALVGRMFLGQWIDRYGARPLWMACSVLYVIGIVLMVQQPSLGWTMYAGRILFAFGLGGMFACSMTHIQNQVPAHRRTEVIGILGSSGFLGMMTGSQLGDLILYFTPDSLIRYTILFGTSGVLGVLYLLIVFGLTRHEIPPAPPKHASPNSVLLLFRHWPGWVVVVAMLMGMGFAGSSVFLTRYATSLGLRGVGTYFTAYAISAFSIRILTRHTSRIYGRHRMIAFGLTGHVVGFTALCLVTQEWHFIFPAICSGIAHALLFPCVISLGTDTFPKQYRGTATTLILSFIDLGAVISAPFLGNLIDHFGFQEMFLFTGISALVVGVMYYITNGQTVDPETLGAHLLEPEPHGASQPATSTPVKPLIPAPAGMAQATTLVTHAGDYEESLPVERKTPDQKESIETKIPCSSHSS